MNTIRVVVEYVQFGQGRVDYAGGRFCYHSDALIDIEIPDGATPVQALIYDLHKPDEIIRITFMQSRHRRRMSPDPDHDALDPREDRSMSEGKQPDQEVDETREIDMLAELNEPDQLELFGEDPFRERMIPRDAER